MELTIEQTLQQGVAAHKEGKLQEAERLYRTVLQVQPKHPDANHNLGVLSVSSGKSAAALPLFKTALGANPNQGQFWLSYIDALIKEKQFENAKEILAQGKKSGLSEEKVDALSQQLTLITQAGESKLSEQKKRLTFAEKRQKLSEKKKKKKAKSPSQTELNTLLEHYQNGRYDDAEKLAISITEQFPEHQFSWKVLGVVLKQTGRISESLVAGQKAVDLDPQDAQAHNNLGNTLRNLGRLEEAEASYRQAISLKPDYVEAHNNLGNALRDLGRLEEAEASYTQAIALKPDYAEAHSLLGVTLQALGRLEEADASYRQAIALEPNYAEAHNNLGNMLHELGRLEEAEASYRQAIAIKPDLAEAHSSLGITLQVLGRLEEAEASYRHAIALKPDFNQALKNRWQLLFDKKEFEAALRDADLCNFKGARELDLTTLYALGRIEEIYKRIEMQSKVDGENISIAAFAAFVAEAEKKNTAYNFCHNPIEFIHFANLSSHLKDSAAFITEVIEELHKVETIWEPSGKTTVSGFQSPFGVNLFESPSGKIAQLRSIIIDELDAYYLKFQNKSCSYIQKWPTEKNLFGWHVILKHQGHQTVHFHPSGWLSGVIYLKVVPSLGKEEGAIRFSLDGKNYSNVNSPKLTYQPESGDIVFFPSSLHHRTIPFTTDTDRIIVSFDLMPEAAKKEAKE